MGHVVALLKPKRDDLWFRQMLMADPDTMSYNAAWGGTIAFPDQQWDDWYDWWLVHHEGRRFYRYLVDTKTGDFVGEVAYHFDDDERIYLADVIVLASKRGRGYGRAGLDLLCEVAKENGVVTLYDNIACDNPAVGLFLSCGFVEERRTDEVIYLRRDL